jgi:quercetin dioxygenase-like cupin family protein
MEKPPPKFTVLIKSELTGAQGSQVSVGLAEVPPHFKGAPHLHVGDEVVFMLEGSITFTLDGKSDVTLKAGETCHIPAKQVHFGTTANEQVKFLSIQVQESGTPVGRLQAE